MNKAVFFLFLVGLAMSGGAQGSDPVGEPEILPSEVLAPSQDWRDAGWKPFYEMAEDPTTIRCGGRQGCEAFKQNATREVQR